MYQVFGPPQPKKKVDCRGLDKLVALRPKTKDSIFSYFNKKKKKKKKSSTTPETSIAEYLILCELMRSRRGYRNIIQEHKTIVLNDLFENKFYKALTMAMAYAFSPFIKIDNEICKIPLQWII
jgi:hypothetical protein